MTPPVWLKVLAAVGFCLIGARTPLAAEQPDPAAPPPPKLVAQGKSLYRQLCSNCHGVNMVNAGTSSFDLRKFPREDQARFVNSVMRGKNTMPAWGDLLKPEEIDALWAYVRTGGKT